MENIIGQIKESVSTRSCISNFCKHTAFVSQIEPKSIDEALKDEKCDVYDHPLFMKKKQFFLVRTIYYFG